MNPLTPMLGSGSPPLPVRAQAALLVIDMQNAYCHPDGVFARSAPDPLACQRVILPCGELVGTARAAGVPVLHAAKVSLAPAVATASFHNTRRAGPGMMQVGEWDAEIVDGVRPAPGEIVLHKLAYSAFFGTALDPVLQRLGTRALVLVGVTTSICVESTARDAAQRGFDVYVVGDASAEWVPQRHERAIEQLGYAFARIVTTRQLADAWQVTARQR